MGWSRRDGSVPQEGAAEVATLWKRDESPELEAEDVTQALQYAAWAVSDQLVSRTA